MLNYKNATITFSAELSTLDASTNTRRTEHAIRWLKERNFEYQVVFGVYKGVREISMQVTVLNELEAQIIADNALINWAQESILIRCGADSYLQDEDKTLYIGKWEEVTKATAGRLQAYTFFPSTNEYFAVR